VGEMGHAYTFRQIIRKEFNATIIIINIPKHDLINKNKHDNNTKLAAHNIVTGLINELPGSSSANTVQHATIEEAVFSVDSDRHANRLAG
jgi:hypothetical protein